MPSSFRQGVSYVFLSCICIAHKTGFPMLQIHINRVRLRIFANRKNENELGAEENEA